ncbi:MAG TPA: hypothetical protein DCK97_00400, partial [Tistrella mobilis]|nr:hypothetical protein [Tistrella mobilis]
AGGAGGAAGAIDRARRPRGRPHLGSQVSVAGRGQGRRLGAGRHLRRLIGQRCRGAGDSGREGPLLTRVGRPLGTAPGRRRSGRGRGRLLFGGGKIQLGPGGRLGRGGCGAHRLRRRLGLRPLTTDLLPRGGRRLPQLDDILAQFTGRD